MSCIFAELVKNLSIRRYVMRRYGIRRYGIRRYGMFVAIVDKAIWLILIVEVDLLLSEFWRCYFIPGTTKIIRRPVVKFALTIKIDKVINQLRNMEV